MLLKISEVAEMLNISIHTIRYYEKLGMIQVNRQNSIRVFTEQDVKLLRAILEWKELGFTLEQVKTIAALEKNGLGCKDVQLNELKEGLALTKLEELKKLRVQIDTSIHELERFLSVVKILQEKGEFT
ncbi:MerR family transcriptional regulator [Brevibacillus sp. SYSU BS000544]|uniref:helix-turn-helix domain-containing protein n=1 Tax=Brevibacillus sp. SYSU BS000544 TaxID=3416443 RepID=UPI003CE55052